MSESKEILLITTNKSLFDDVRSFLKKENIKLRLGISRSDATEKLSTINFDIVFFDETIGARDLKFILRTLNSQNKEGLIIYYASSDFDIFSEIMASTELNLHIINMPVANEDIAMRLSSHLTVKDADEKSAKFSKNVDAKFLNVFIDATTMVLKEMANVGNIKNLRPNLLKTLDVEKIAIRGKLRLNTKYFKGTFYISFPEKTYLKIYESILMEKHDCISEEMKDFATELLNVIYGQAKNTLNKLGHNLDMIIPVIDCEENVVDETSTIAIPFDSKFGKFYIKIEPDK